MRILLLLLAMLAQPVLAREGLALIVAVDRYEHVSALEHAEADAGLLARSLLQAGYQVDLVPGARADRVEVERRLALLAESARPDEPVLVVFLGHALQGHLMLRDSHPARLETTALSPERLARSLTGLRYLVLLDAWRNEPIEARCCSDNRLTAEVAARFSAALFACSPGQRAFDWSERGHGFFAYYLAEAMGVGHRSPEALAAYLAARVDRDCRRVMLQSQRPYLNR